MQLKGTVLAIGVLLTGCGGSGSTGSNPGTGTGNGPVYQAGVFAPEAQYKNYCAAPRQGIDPYTQAAYPDKTGSALHEQLWLRSWSNRTYLWYNEIPDLNPAGYGVEQYFDLLQTSGLTDSGARKDKYHFTEDTAEYLQQTESGLESGYGISWSAQRTTPPRQFTVAYVEPDSPAAIAGISRGDKLRYVDGVDFVFDNTEAGVAKLLLGLFPQNAGEPHQLVFEKNSGASATFNLVSKDVLVSPVQHVAVLETAAGKVGYLTFNSHIAIAQPQLIAAVKQFKQANINDLIIDLRYNGGGLLALASQFAYMVAGDNIIQDRFFEKMQFNDKYPNTNPITGQTLQPVPFYDFVINYDAGVGTSEKLPELGLSRVFVLTGNGTCSASEAFINALRGVDVEVIQIGQQTCGKPYGFYPQDNCGTTYFTIQFGGVNAKGFGDYADGFVPSIAPTFAADIKGCQVADDFTQALGDANEARLKTALHYIRYNQCPLTAATAATSENTRNLWNIPAVNNAEDSRFITRSLWHDNRIHTPITVPEK